MKERLTTRMRRVAGRTLWPGESTVVLLYHRIADEPADPYGLCVSPRHFEEQLEVIRQTARPVRLGELARAVRHGGVPRRGVCITFDDGYLDNSTVARKLLERHGIPATIFIITGHAGRQREFWWDELERVFFDAARVLDKLEVEVDGRQHVWDFAREERVVSAGVASPGRWHLHEAPPPTSRHAAFQEAYSAIQPLPERERTRVLDDLMAAAGIDGSRLRPSRRALEAYEVVELARDPLIEIGAHTVSHPALPAQPRAVQCEEITRSKADLESWLEAEVTGFSYPYGQYDAVSVATVRDAGFSYACSCDFRAVRRYGDPFTLPRVLAPDADGDALAQLLNEYL